jgi:hypothetical protein
MPVPPTTPHDNAAILVIVLVAGYFCAFYWRTALRLVAILLIAAAVYGLIIGLHVL